MQIELQIGKEPVVLRGNDDGTVDLCHWVDMKHGEVMKPVLIPFKYFTSLASALHRVAEMKVCRSDASTLQELAQVFEEEKKWFHATLKI